MSGLWSVVAIVLLSDQVALTDPTLQEFPPHLAHGDGLDLLDPLARERRSTAGTGSVVTRDGDSCCGTVFELVMQATFVKCFTYTIACFLT